MFDNITKFFKKLKKSEKEESKNTAKERLHLVLAQDRANISADFLELMKQEIIEVIKKYIDIDEKAIDVRLTNKESEDGVTGAPALYANIPIITIKNEARKLEGFSRKEERIEEESEQIEENTKTEETANCDDKKENEANIEKENNVENVDEKEKSIVDSEVKQKQKKKDEEKLNEGKDEKKDS